MLPADAYKGSDSAAGERFPPGWSASFPHAITATGPAFFAQWLRTPFADEYLGRLVTAAVDRLSLGRGTGVDLLAVSFSTLDLVGHQYGPDSHEVQDLVVRLDRTVGALLDHLDRQVGRGKYVVALSSDHGVGQLPESIPDGGRQSGAQALAAINNALKPFLGEGLHATQSAYTDLYFAPGVASKVTSKPEASAAVIAALQALPGIAHAFFASEVSSAAARTHPDPVRRAAALSYHPERSGDILIVPKPGWMLSTSAAATHGTLYPHDQRVPVLFFGAGVTASRSDAAATPADIAPTLAALAGVKFTTADGRPLLGAR
jgi:arylsulfatase A-like enzyme